MRQRFLIAALLLVVSIAPVAGHACVQRVKTELAPETFASELDALRALANQVLNDSITYDVEFAGALYRNRFDGVRASIGRGCPGVDSIEFTVPHLDGEPPIAYWHTHGRDGFARDRFSPDDAELVRREGRPFYLITPRGKIRVLDAYRVTRDAPVRSRRSLLREQVGYVGRHVDETT
jgi:hypothetical protein